MQKIFNAVVIVALFLVLVSAVSPMTFAPEGDLSDKLTDAYLYVETIGDYVKRAYDFVTETVDHHVTTFDNIGTWMSQLRNSIVDTVETCISGIKTVIDNIGSWMKEVRDTIVDTFEPVIRWISKVYTWITDAISNILDFFGADNSDIPVIDDFTGSVPWLQQLIT